MEVNYDWNNGTGKHAFTVPTGTTVQRLYQLIGGPDGKESEYSADVDDGKSGKDWSEVLKPGQTVIFRKYLS